MKANGQYLVQEKTKVKASSGSSSLRDHVRVSVEDYFRKLNGDEAGGLYQLLLAVMEEPLFEVVMKESRGNLSKASRILGLNRGTLKKKISAYKFPDN